MAIVRIAEFSGNTIVVHFWGESAHIKRDAPDGLCDDWPGVR